MPEMEKVIKGLKCCSEGGSKYCYEGRCPYASMPLSCRKELEADALALLKEQEEKDEKILTALDGYRMCDEMSKNAYENLTKLIQSKRGEVE